MSDQIPHWDLEQLCSTADLPKHLNDLDEYKNDFVQWRKLLDAPDLSLADFENIVVSLEKLYSLAHRLTALARLRVAQNTQDQKALAFMGQMDEKMAELANDVLFFEIWWKELPLEKAAPFLAAQPDFAYWLERTRAFKPFTLTEPEEKIINLKSITGSEALTSLYDTITNRYKFSTAKIPGAPKAELTRDQLMVYVRSAQKEQRAAAYQELYQQFEADGPILGQIYQNLVRDWQMENVRLRHYENPNDVRHMANDLSPKAVEALLNVARQSDVFREFFRFKAQSLALENFSRYDLYAPLAEDDDTWSFDEGLAEVLAAFESFSPKFRDLAAKIVESRQLSAQGQAGKQGGAFCYSILPQSTPWVLMTYNGRRQDLFTLAHELGHGLHSQLASHHNLFHFHATLPLAETASTFGEMLLADRLLKKASNPKARAGLLFHLLDDAYATVGRQAFFNLFEIEAHGLIEKGATVDELSDAYITNLTEQFGQAVTLPSEFRWEWVSIPHFYHTPFYVYAYTFGQLLVYSLWRQYEKQGPDFVPRLTALLARGGSASPENILAESGLGPLDEDFWRGGFEVIARFLDELKQIDI